MVDSFSTAFIKKEAVYGTDAAPTAALNATVMRNFKATPLAFDMIQRNLDKPARGATPGVPTNFRQPFGYELELAGSGAAGTAAPWMEHLEACGMAPPVLTAGVRAEQRFAAIGAAQSSLTAYHWRDTQRRRAFGVRGDIATIDFTAGAYPFVGLSMTGLIPTGVSPFDEAAFGGVPSFARWKDPMEVSSANTQFMFDGYAAVLRSMKLQANADVKLRNLVGARYVQRGNHAMSGRLMIEAPTISAKNYFTQTVTGALATLQIIHGVGAGNIVQVDAANAQITSIDDAEEDGIAMFDIGIQLNIVAGQDDILLTAK
jgi:hypothetical protein